MEKGSCSIIHLFVIELTGDAEHFEEAIACIPVVVDLCLVTLNGTKAGNTTVLRHDT